MEALVTIVEVGAYSERQYQRQDGTAESGATTTIATKMYCIFLIFSHFNLKNHIYVLLSEEY